MDRLVEPKEHTFKGIAALLGWEWPEIESTGSPVIQAGKPYHFNLYWVHLGMAPEDAFYVRLVDRQSRIAVEALSFDQPDSPLISGQLFVDKINVSLPGNLVRGSYHLQIGFLTRAVEAGELNFLLPDEMTEILVK